MGKMEILCTIKDKKELKFSFSETTQGENGKEAKYNSWHLSGLPAHGILLSLGWSHIHPPNYIHPHDRIMQWSEAISLFWGFNFGDELINSQMIEPRSEVKQIWGQTQAILLAISIWVKYNLSSFFKP